jgi:hypothetical protein
VSNLEDSIHSYRLDAERASAAGLDRAATDLLSKQLGGSEPTSTCRSLAPGARPAGTSASL